MFQNNACTPRHIITNKMYSSLLNNAYKKINPPPCSTTWQSKHAYDKFRDKAKNQNKYGNVLNDTIVFYNLNSFL